jgi:hypothetical protein
MIPVFDLCAQFDPDYEEPFELAKRKTVVWSKTNSPREMSKDEKKGFERVRVNQAIDYTYKGWQ